MKSEGRERLLDHPRQIGTTEGQESALHERLLELPPVHMYLLAADLCQHPVGLQNVQRPSQCIFQYSNGTTGYQQRLHACSHGVMSSEQFDNTLPPYMLDMPFDTLAQTLLLLHTERSVELLSQSPCLTLRLHEGQNISCSME